MEWNTHTGFTHHYFSVKFLTEALFGKIAFEVSFDSNTMYFNSLILLLRVRDTVSSKIKRIKLKKGSRLGPFSKHMYELCQEQLKMRRKNVDFFYHWFYLSQPKHIV